MTDHSPLSAEEQRLLQHLRSHRRLDRGLDCMEHAIWQPSMGPLPLYLAELGLVISSGLHRARHHDEPEPSKRGGSPAIHQ